MKLWKLESKRERPEWHWPYDKNHGLVVRAADEATARAMAALESSDEGPDVWLDDAGTTCIEISIAGEPEVLMIDFCAG